MVRVLRDAPLHMLDLVHCSPLVALLNLELQAFLKVQFCSLLLVVIRMHLLDLSLELVLLRLVEIL